MTRVYIDTNVFLNVINEERNLYGKDMSKASAKLFFETISCKYYLIISTWTLREIYRKIRLEDIAMLFEMIKKKIISIEYDDADITEAKQKSEDNFDDALHIVLAEKAKADMIVTRNISDFLKIGTSVPIRKPENL